MTIEEYESELRELERQLAELKAAKIEEDNPQPPHPRWKPKKGSTYFCVSPCAKDTSCMCVWDDDRYDNNQYNIGNVFFTKAEGEFAGERLKVFAQMREWAGRWNDAYAINYNGKSDDITISYTLSQNSNGETRFATKEDVENCIKAVGKERLKKYYFMITEE